MLDTLFFLFKQKTAYEMRISDWSSDVCSSDLLVGVGREGNACSIAAGLHTGGRKPMILIQNTGMLESGDSIRGWLMGLNVPVVLLVGYRGSPRHGVHPRTVATYPEPLTTAPPPNLQHRPAPRPERLGPPPYTPAGADHTQKQ